MAKAKAKTKVTNPVTQINIDDIFDKDPDDITLADRQRLVAFYRNLRAEWYKKEDEKADKKRAKANPAPAKNEDELLGMKLSEF